MVVMGGGDTGVVGFYSAFFSLNFTSEIVNDGTNLSRIVVAVLDN